MPIPITLVDAADVNPNELAVLQLQQKTAATVTATLRSATGTVYVIPASHTVKLVAVETPTTTSKYLDKSCTIVDAATGSISVTLAAGDLPLTGIWLGEFTVYNASSAAVKRFRCYVEVEGSLTEVQTDTPLTIAEIRMAMRDRCADDNFLLDKTEFSNSEIMASIRRPVDWWNETAPPGFNTYSYTTFPYRYHWLDATVGELLRIASYNLTRNRLPINSGGLQTDDKARADVYLQLGASLIAEWRKWAVMKMRQLNVAQWVGSTKIREFGR